MINASAIADSAAAIVKINKDKICPNNSFCSCIHTYEFYVGDVVEFVIVDEEPLFNSNHPMHLHGNSFAILAIEKVINISSIQIIYLNKIYKLGKSINYNR